MRALNEYFVGGIKTNISLFRRILDDPDFQAGRLDTGFLDRLLAGKQNHGATDSDNNVAAIAAGVFAILDPESISLDGSSNKSGLQGTRQSVSSTWKRAGRVEGVQ
jgi:acetyl-CoA carboxylase biotin carboxylase subunit